MTVKYNTLAMAENHHYGKLFYEQTTKDKERVLTQLKQLAEENPDYLIRANVADFSDIAMAIAFRRIWTEDGKSESEIRRTLAGYLWEAVLPQRKWMQRLMSVSFLWKPVRWLLPKIIQSANGHGFQTAVPEEVPANEIRFCVHECLICSMVRKYEMPDWMGSMFCRCDEIRYGDLPSVQFLRTETLCRGGDCCDFCFVRKLPEENPGKHPVQHSRPGISSPRRV